MKTAALHELGQLDAWVLSTYQRLERMDVPVFDVAGTAPIRDLTRDVVPATLYRLPTALPHCAGDFGNWLRTGHLPGIVGQDSVTRLSMLLRYLAAPLRYEPETESPVHKAVPSARCLFPIDYYLLQRRGGMTRAWQYVPEHHGFIAADFDATADFTGESALVAVAKIWRIAEKYGEFAHFPPVLEAGHAAAQIGYLAAAFGLEGLSVSSREIGRGLCRSRFDLPLFTVDLSVPELDVASSLESATVRVLVTGERGGLGERFDRLITFQNLFDRGAVLPRAVGGRAPAVGSADLGIDFLEVLRRRNAGNDRSGTAAMMLDAPAELLPDLLGLWRQVAARRPQLPGEAVTTASLAWLAGGAAAPGLYASDGGLRTPGRSLSEFRAAVAGMLPYRGMRFNLATLAATLVITADPLTAVEQLGASAIREVHLAAGAIAQDFSLAATALGLFARPVRMMREAAIERALPLDGQTVYQVLCGVARRASMSMELL